MKIKRLNKYLLYTLFGGSILFTSCNSDDESTPKGAYEHGVFITNEGNFGTPNGEVSYYDPNTKTVIPELFKKINDRPLGDVVQSMTVANDKAYIVANNSGKVEVVNANTFEELGVINSLEMPRYMTVLNSQKGYVTEWVGYGVNGRVAVVDLATNTVSKTIEVGEMPEHLLLLNNKLYVANSGGNTVTVINTATDQVERTLTLFNGPNSLAVDASGNIWVLCGLTFYNPDYSVDYERTTVGHLVKFNPSTPENQTTLAFASNEYQPRGLTINQAKDKLYYQYNKGVYAVSTNASALPTTPLLRRTNLYGFGVSPQEGLIYVGDGGYSTNGQVIRFQPSGERIDSFQVRILPNGFTFR